MFEPFGGRSVVVRTLDAGADKPLAFADLGPEGNPALGRRGLRLSARDPDLLDTQLAALARAARATGADVRVMAPMVATAEEAAWFAAPGPRERAADRSGVMIEVPAAALRARDVLAEVDFGSIGTNDLAQYTLAADRMPGELADLLDPWQPAVLDLVAHRLRGRARTRRPADRGLRRGGRRPAAGAGAGRARRDEPVDGTAEGVGRALRPVAARPGHLRRRWRRWRGRPCPRRPPGPRWRGWPTPRWRGWPTPRWSSRSSRPPRRGAASAARPPPPSSTAAPSGSRPGESVEASRGGWAKMGC